MSYFFESFYSEYTQSWIDGGSVFDDRKLFEKKLKNYEVQL